MSNNKLSTERNDKSFGRLINFKNGVFIDANDIVAVIPYELTDEQTRRNASKWYDEEKSTPRSVLTLRGRERDVITSTLPATVLEKIEAAATKFRKH